MYGVHHIKDIWNAFVGKHPELQCIEMDMRYTTWLAAVCNLIGGNEFARGHKHQANICDWICKNPPHTHKN